MGLAALHTHKGSDPMTTSSPKQTINFVYRFSGYSKIVNSFVRPIIPYLPSYTISDKPRPNALNVHFFIEKHEGGGVFLPHGLADKNYRKPELLNNFDIILLSGEAWKQKMISQGIPAEKLIVAGYPKLDPVFQNLVPSPSPLVGKKLKVLWAPTHNAIQEVSSYPAFLKYVDELKECVNFVSAPHPAGNMNPVTLQDLVDADVVLSDSSSLIYEAMALGKPVILLSWLVRDGIYKKFPNTFEEQLYRESICYQANCFSDLVDWLTAKRNLLQFTPSMRKFADGVFSERLHGISGKIIANILGGLLNGSMER